MSFQRMTGKPLSPRLVEGETVSPVADTTAVNRQTKKKRKTRRRKSKRVTATSRPAEPPTPAESVVQPVETAKPTDKANVSVKDMNPAQFEAHMVVVGRVTAKQILQRFFSHMWVLHQSDPLFTEEAIYNTPDDQVSERFVVLARAFATGDNEVHVLDTAREAINYYIKQDRYEIRRKLNALDWLFSFEGGGSALYERLFPRENDPYSRLFDEENEQGELAASE